MMFFRDEVSERISPARTVTERNDYLTLRESNECEATRAEGRMSSPCTNDTSSPLHKFRGASPTGEAIINAFINMPSLVRGELPVKKNIDDVF